MRAAVRERFGPVEAIELRDVDVPTPADDEVLVRVRASSVNPADWYSVTGRPYVGRLDAGLLRPKSARIGVDFAGTVEAVGRAVTRFRAGDEVYGGKSGAFAEYVCVRKAIVPKPANATFEQAAALPTAALTALQGLRDKGGVAPGTTALVNGASGGVGTFAVQIAKALGAEVTAVCSTPNVELVRSLGADRVVDYTREDFTRGDRPHQVILDVAGSRSWSDVRRVLDPDGILVIVGAPKGDAVLGPLTRMVGLKAASILNSQRALFFISRLDPSDLETLRELVENGQVNPVIDRQYELAELTEALRYLGEGHARGKIVITV